MDADQEGRPAEIDAMIKQLDLPVLFIDEKRDAAKYATFYPRCICPAR